MAPKMAAIPEFLTLWQGYPSKILTIEPGRPENRPYWEALDPKGRLPSLPCEPVSSELLKLVMHIPAHYVLTFLLQLPSLAS